MTKYKFSLLLAIIFFSLGSQVCYAQEDSVEAVPIFRMHYYNNNNKLQYLLLESLIKKGKTFTPQANKSYRLYLDSSSDANLIADLKTDVNGKAKAFIGPSLKTAWDASATHTFILKEGDQEVVTDYMITKSKISIDTANNDGVRALVATVQKLEAEQWVPVADVEMKVGIQRMGGLLSAGAEETYTTDSTGSVTVDLTRIDVPGDKAGNYIIAARVDDNEGLGNLLVEKTVPWGKATVAEKGFFDQRTLWSTRFKVPYWLLFMAGSILIGVWATLIYLVVQIVKIKKLGDQESKSKKVIITGTGVPIAGS